MFLLSENEILINKRKNGVLILTLNRPEALNSLNLNMVSTIYEHLKKGETDSSVKVVVINGSGDKAFCAGGDIKTFYKAKSDEKIKRSAVDFFEEEYKLDEYIYNYPKPIIANLDGIAMGGGIGLTFGAQFRVVTESTRWAMPEINLGFFPDVGAGFFLNQMRDYIGLYLALTGKMVSGKDVLYANAADYLISSSQIDECMKTIIEKMNYNKDTVNEQIIEILEKYKLDYKMSELEKTEKIITKHFKHDSIEQILSSLKNDKSEFSQKHYRLLNEKSPVSLKVILKQLEYCKEKTISETLEIDRILVSNFLNHNDFYEGVRSVLIDKDSNPRYEHLTLEEVSATFVNSFFKNKYV